MALEIGPGDEVICPSFTFVSTANAIVRQRAKPVFCDVCEDTLNLDPTDVAAKLTSRTRAVIVVHYGGIACDMDSFQKLARRHRLAIVEDAAHAIGAKYRGRHLGTLGDMGCYSFHETKNLTCGEGGALLTDDRVHAARAEIIREKGTDRAAFLRGEVNKYTWQSEGSSYLLSEVLAAVLAAQWKKLARITRRRREIFQRYMERLAPLQRAGDLTLPFVPAGCETNGHLFYVRLPSERARNRCLANLRGRGIGAAFHFVPLHSSPYGRQFGIQPGALPVTERASRTLLRLPLYPQLRNRDVDFISTSLEAVLRKGVRHGS